MNYFQLQHILSPEVLDALLEKGFYRMQQSVFTTSAIYIDNSVIEVVWLRVRLEDFLPGKRYTELLKRNKNYSITLAKARIDKEIDELYAAYYSSIDFDGPESVSSFLMGENLQNFFPSKMWQVRDQGKLVAVGYFDEGDKTTAGIMNFYHPEYKKYSLGTLLYYKSILHAQETGKRFFYPGYVAMGYPKFDYKLLAGKHCIEYWDSLRHTWKPYYYSYHSMQ